jgi:hypothetical protein
MTAMTASTSCDDDFGCAPLHSSISIFPQVGALGGFS